MITKAIFPLISVCIPTYNGEAYLHEALESIAIQAYRNLEIIISDDASTDDTLKIIREFQKTSHFPIKIFNHTPNGIGANWNNCIKYSSGVYIKFLFQDDVLLPDCIETMVHYLVKYPSLGLIAGKRQIIYEHTYDTEMAQDWIQRFGDLQKELSLEYIDGIAILRQELFRHKQFLKSPLNKIGEPSVFMIRREVFEEVGYFRTDLKQILDYEFCYRLLKNYPIGIINKPLVQFRLHPKQTTRVNSNMPKASEDNRNEGYSKILYDNFLDLLDPYIQKHLKKRYNIFYKITYGLKARWKKIFNKKVMM